MIFCLKLEITEFNSSLIAQTAKIKANILKKDRKKNWGSVCRRAVWI